MGNCCENECHFDPQKQGSTLKIVLAINLIMFIIILIASFYSGSSALLSDSLDNFGDAVTYGLSLYAVSKTNVFKAKVALMKGLLILIAALAVIGQIIYKLIYPFVPLYETMGIFSFIGLMANLICLVLLTRHRSEDINMDSIWECSRNDIFSNLSVLLAAFCVWLFHSGWPDILLAFGLSILLLRSSKRIITSALKQLKNQ